MNSRQKLSQYRYYMHVNDHLALDRHFVRPRSGSALMTQSSDLCSCLENMSHLSLISD